MTLLEGLVEGNPDTVWHRPATGALFLQDKKLQVFLQERDDKTIYYPDSYGLWGGRADHGETPRQTFFRETFEETGYQVTHHEFLGLYQWSGDDNLDIFVFRVYEPAITVNDLQVNEGRGGSFFSIDDALRHGVAFDAEKVLEPARTLGQGYRTTPDMIPGDWRVK